MQEFLFCCLRLGSKETYLIINIIDIIFYLMQVGILQNIIKVYIFNQEIANVIDICMLVISIVCLFIYIKKKYWRSTWHTIYMLLRFFITILSCIYWTVALVERLQHKSYGEFGLFIVIGLFFYINLWWSYLFFKLIN